MTIAKALLSNAATDGEFRDYVYAVSHDVGAPVRAMVEFSQLLTDDHAQELSDEGKLYLSMIIGNGRKLQAMMDGLLDYSRLNTEARPFTRVDCNSALANAIITLNDVIDKEQALIDKQALPEIVGDPTQIWQLFVALLDNALKFHHAGDKPHIKISMQRQGRFWEFSVADNGVGIDEKFHQKIFGAFQRLHSDDEYPGIGMGLALAQKIVRRHGGKIWIDSSSAKGAVFHFTLTA